MALKNGGIPFALQSAAGHRDGAKPPRFQVGAAAHRASTLIPIPAAYHFDHRFGEPHFRHLPRCDACRIQNLTDEVD